MDLKVENLGKYNIVIISLNKKGRESSDSLQQFIDNVIV